MKQSLILILFIASITAYAQDELYLSDPRIPGIDTVWVFTPTDYDQRISYPIVYMLHGYSSNYQQWHLIMNADEYADKYQMIIVCPDGFYNSWYLNSPLKQSSQYASFFKNVLLPTVEAKYNVDINNRFITGLSMGGHGSFYLFYSFPDLFRSAGSTSGVMDLRGSAGLFELHDHLGTLEENRSSWLSLSAVGNIDQLEMIDKPIILDCGTEDPFYEWNKDFYELCLERKLQVTFISQPGEHTWDYWGKSIKAHFEYFKSKIEN